MFATLVFNELYNKCRTCNASPKLLCPPSWLDWKSCYINRVQWVKRGGAKFSRFRPNGIRHMVPREIRQAVSITISLFCCVPNQLRKFSVVFTVFLRDCAVSKTTCEFGIGQFSDITCWLHSFGDISAVVFLFLWRFYLRVTMVYLTVGGGV